MSVAKRGTDDHDCGNTNNDMLHQAICRLVAVGRHRRGGGRQRLASTPPSSSPASYNEVITVSALADTDGKPGGTRRRRSATRGARYDKDDTFADFSNYGGDVDLIAPGKCIWSTLPGNRLRLLVRHLDGRAARDRRGRAVQGVAPARDARGGPGGTPCGWATSTGRPRPTRTGTTSRCSTSRTWSISATSRSMRRLDVALRARRRGRRVAGRFPSRSSAREDVPGRGGPRDHRTGAARGRPRLAQRWPGRTRSPRRCGSTVPDGHSQRDVHRHRHGRSTGLASAHPTFPVVVDSDPPERDGPGASRCARGRSLGAGLERRRHVGRGIGPDGHDRPLRGPLACGWQPRGPTTSVPARRASASRSMIASATPTHCALRARDTAGNWSPWSEASPFAPVVVQDTSPTLSRSGGWTRYDRSWHVRRHVALRTHTGQVGRACRSLVAAIALVGPKSPEARQRQGLDRRRAGSRRSTSAGPPPRTARWCSPGRGPRPERTPSRSSCSARPAGRAWTSTPSSSSRRRDARARARGAPCR